MTLGERLRKYLPDGVEQKVIAMNWISRMQSAGMKTLSPATAPSRLSELLADDAQGVRAFFRDPRRANALFDELAVPEADRVELRRLAEPILAGAPQPRLVVDLSDLGNNRTTMDAAFVGARDALFGEDGMFPVALVLTDAQYDLLPRSFDRFKDKMQVERVADPAAGANAAVRLAGSRTCVVSHRPLVELARWWAVDVENGALLLEPKDGLARIRATGSIGVPAVAHPLAAPPALAGAKATLNVPASGVARRRLVAELADEGSAVAKKDVAWRSAAARALGVQATSTKRERIEAEISAIVATLGIEVTTGSAEEWDARVARAARRPTEPFALRVGDSIRVLNPAASIAPAGRLEVTHVACAEPHIVTLERALSDYTEDDLLDDPILGRLVFRLAGNDTQALKLLFHARAVLVYGGRVKPKAPRAAKDPLAVLQHILACDVPQAQLRIRVSEPPSTFGSGLCNVELAPFAYPDGRIYYDQLQQARLLYGVPPVGDVLFTRGSRLKAVIPTTGKESDGGYYGGYYSWDEAGSPPVLVDPRADASRWLDDVEASAFFGATDGGRGWSPKRHLPEPKAGHQWRTVNEPSDLWLNADTILGLAWLALRDALPAPRWIRLPDGSILLQVGGGLAARVVARRFGPKESAVRGAVRCAIAREGSIHDPKWHFCDLTAPVTTHVAKTDDYNTRISVLMPSIWIAGCGFAADISFVPAPMLPGRAASETTLATAAAGAVAAAHNEALQERLREMWDYDD